MRDLLQVYLLDRHNRTARIYVSGGREDAIIRVSVKK